MAPDIRAEVVNQCLEALSLQEDSSLSDIIASFEKEILLKTLSRFNGNVKDSAHFLGLKYTTLHQKMKKYHISFRKLPITN